MLYISLVFSLLLLGFTCIAVRMLGKVSSGSQVAWLGLVPGLGSVLVGFLLPIYLLNVVLVGVGGLLCGHLQVRERWFYAWCLGATLASYAVGASYARDDFLEAARLTRVDSMTERLVYEDRRQNAPWYNESNGDAAAHEDIDDRLRLFDRLVSNAENHTPENRPAALKYLHEHRVAEFVNSRGFGVARIRDFKIPAKPPEEATIAMQPLDQVESESATTTASVSNELLSASGDLHWNSLLDFVNPNGFGWVKDREHVIGFQSHQFHRRPEWNESTKPPVSWTLKRLELVSLLTHDEPGVYVADHLPRMDLLRDVPFRPLDEFERTGLPRLLHGEEIVLSQTGNRLRMLGEIRAGEQCLSCHSARRGDLLGAFSYHFDAKR